VTRSRTALFGGGLLALVASTPHLGAATHRTQDRSITAATSLDGDTQTRVAPDFVSFVQTSNLSTAVAGIDCHLDPDKIKASGRLLAGPGMTGDGTTVATGIAQATNARRACQELSGKSLCSYDRAS
jgi:hypothetical protein